MRVASASFSSRSLTENAPAEKSRAIDSEYTRWVEAYKERFLGSSPDSLNPRIVGTEGQERGGLRVGTYHMLRNLLAGTLSHESSARRIATLQDSPAPADEDNDRVMRGMERFLQLTLVPALPGEDEWPNTQMFAKRRENDIPVPHRVWRLRQEQLAQERALRHGVVQFAPVELQILPTVVNMDRFKDLSDGEMLELVEKLRIHIHDSIPGEVKDNTKTYDLVNHGSRAFSLARPAGLARANDESCAGHSTRARSSASIATTASCARRPPPRAAASASTPTATTTLRRARNAKRICRVVLPRLARRSRPARAQGLDNASAA